MADKGCGCAKNKILKLGDMKNMSLDEIMGLYREGYRLEGSTPNPNSSNFNSSVSRIYTTQYNSVSIINPPTSVVPGQTIDFNIRYDLNVDWIGEWVRFRICHANGGVGTEIGNNIELLFGHAVGNVTITATFPSTITTPTVIVRAEVTRDELNSTCGDPDVMSSTAIEMTVVTQAPNTISLLNLPESVQPGRSIDFQISYNLSVSWYGEWVRFRTCRNGTEIGNSISLLFGNAIGAKTVPVTIPSDATGTISIKAEVTINELSGTCEDPDVIASTSPVNIPVGALNIISLVGLPESVQSGRSVDFSISYSLSVSGVGEWVRFRICDVTGAPIEIGNNIEWLIGNASGVMKVTAAIPGEVTGTISIKAEVTIDELSSTCEDPYVIATAGPVNIPIAIGNIISITNVPTSVAAGERVDLTINYNLGLDPIIGEWVRFRICDVTGTPIEIANSIELFFGNVSGNISISTQIPISATGTISLRAEVTIDELSSTCEDPDVIASTTPVDIPVIGAVNSITITNMPTTAAAGQDIVFTIDYNLPSISLPEIVRFRICANGGEIGSNIETLVLNVGGSTTVTAKIPEGATGSILIRAEVTIDELSSSCGDPDVIARTVEVEVPLTGAVLCTQPQLFVDGRKGVVYYPDVPVTITLRHCGEANDDYIIDRTDITPDINISTGVTDANGVATVPLTIDLKGVYRFQSGEDCIVGGFVNVCGKIGNEVTVYAGVTPEECVIPNPVTGGCLLTRQGLTYIVIGAGGLVGLYLLSKAYFGRPRAPKSTPSVKEEKR